MRRRGFWHELKRRHVYRVAVAYVVVGWLLIQVVTQVFPVFHLPDWIDQTVVLLILMGFPIVLVLAWAFDATPAGIVRTDAKSDPANKDTIPPWRSRRAGIAVGLIGVLIAVIVGAAYWHFGRGSTMASQRTVAVSAPETTGTQSVSTQRGSTTPQRFAAETSIMATQPIPAKSIAVLPFENLSADKANAYFASGMQDLILTKLADIGDLKVISRTSTMKYASHPDDLKTIAQQLGVATILEGSVQKAGNQVLINVQLINTETDSHLWAESYTRTLDNIFGVEGEVAQKVADALKARLTPTEIARVANVPTTNAAAYDAFLQGTYYEDHYFIPDSTNKAVDYYRQAVSADPRFVLAWGRLANLLSDIARDSASQADAAGAKSALDHALALAPESPDVRMAQAWYLNYVKKDLDGAMAVFSTVARAQPNNAPALFGVGVMHAHKGQWEDALGFVQQAVALAPKDKEFLGELVVAYEALRRYPEAVQTARRLVAIDPADAAGWSKLAHSFESMGDIEDAMATFKDAPSAVRANPYLTFIQALLEEDGRNYASARKLLADLRPVEGISMEALEFVWGNVEQGAGDAARARAHYLRAKRLYGAKYKQHANPNDLRQLALLSAELGQRQEALEQATRYLREDNAKKHFDPFREECENKEDMAVLQATLGNAGEAVEDLHWLLARPTGNLVSVPLLKVDPTWDPIRNDPRFQALLTKYAEERPAPASIIAPAASATGTTP